VLGGRPEHIEDQRAFVDTLVDATRPGGLVVLTTPNARLWDRWRTAGDGFRPQPIEQRLRPRELRGMLADRCRIVRSTTFFFDVAGGHPVERAVDGRVLGRLPRRLRAGLDRARGRLGLGLYQLVVARRA
jgi:hypothetical protein